MTEKFDLSEIDAPMEITAEYVLAQVDDLLIYRYYLGAFQLGRTMKSPFRRDSSPSFSITLNPNWLKLMWKDFGTSEVGDCFKLVAKLNKISYREAVEKVACDFGLVKGCSIVTKKQILEAQAFKEEFQKKEYLIQIDRRAMNNEELAYWESYGITKKELIDNHIYAINKLWVNKKVMSLDVSKLHFAYHFPEVDKWKIYTPDCKDFKWFGNVSAFEIEGLNRVLIINSPLVISKSRKDRIILEKIYSNTISTQNESPLAIPIEMDEGFSHFPSKFIFWDSDKAGKEACKKLNYRGYKWINIPNELYDKHGLKDPSDIVKHFGLKEGLEILKNELKKKNIYYGSDTTKKD